MRKMTKVAVTLAAMSAMTVASASMAFAAAKQETGITGGEWSKQANGSWKYTKEDGKKLKDTWAEIDGIWYYFEGETMAQEDFLYIDNQGYYFDQNGTMATGWQKIRSNTDAYNAIEISDQLKYNEANIYVGENYAYDYLDYVWCCFNEDGTAKENEWFQDVTGFWYYFDNNIMVSNIMNFVIDPDNHDWSDSSSFELYGFDKNGIMLTGWNQVDRLNDKWNDPTWSEGNVTYYYYDMDGTMQKAGWRKIGDDWYLFADTTVQKYGQGGTTPNRVTADNVAAKQYGYPLITNSFIRSNKNVNDMEYFYVDTKGKMVKGVYTVPKKAWDITFYTAADLGDDTVVSANYEVTYLDKNNTHEAYFGTKGAATPNKVVDGKYYIDFDDGKSVPQYLVEVDKSVVNKRVTATVADYKTAVTAVTGGTIAVTSNATVAAFAPKVEAELVKNAFIGVDSDTLYLADEDGYLVTNKAVLISDAAGIVMTSTDKENKDSIYDNAYVLFDAAGEARVGYTGKDRSFTIGGVTYWATNVDATIGNATVTVFVSNKEVNGQR